MNPVPRTTLSPNSSPSSSRPPSPGAHLFHPQDESIPYLNKTEAMAFLKGELSLLSQEIFAKLLVIPEIGEVADTSPIVAGDLDGSHARMMLLAIQAGMIELTKDALYLLVDIIDSESSIIEQLNNPNTDSTYTQILLEKFQSLDKIKKPLENILSGIKITSGVRPLIFIGDCIHDRFANNKPAEMKIRELLKEAGAIFIKGNHDSSVHVSSEAIRRYQMGESAFHGNPTISAETWINHENKVFQNCHYDKETQTLYIHNGIAIAFSTNSQSWKLFSATIMNNSSSDDDDGDINTEQQSGFCEYGIATAFGIINISENFPQTIEDLVTLINSASFEEESPINSSVIPLSSLIIPDRSDKTSCRKFNATTFRPDNATDYIDAIKYININIALPFEKDLSFLEIIRIVRGHDGDHNLGILTDHNQIVNLNPRDRNGYAVVAAIIGGRTPVADTSN